MKFGLVVNLQRPGALNAIQSCLHWGKKHGHAMILCDEVRPVIGTSGKYLSRDKIAAKVDVMISMGGDGTMLATARAVGSTGTPILGINLGSLGFLTQQTPVELESALETIVAGRHTLQERMLLRAQVGKDKSRLKTPYALNDVVINNGDISRVLDITMSVNGEDVVTYVADGLVIATPTGSTAYNLAVGGPILHPSIEAIIASPIAPFSLTTRPMILSANDLLEVIIQSKGREANLTLDGQIMVPVQNGEKVSVRRAEFRTRFVELPDGTFFKVLRNKLNWGLRPGS